MTNPSDAKRLAAQESALSDELTRLDADPSFGSPSLLAVTTVSHAYPTSAAAYFACLPVLLLGTEREGGAGDLTTGSSSYLALNVGSTVPPVGTKVLTTFVGNRWVFRYDA